MHKKTRNSRKVIVALVAVIAALFVGLGGPSAALDLVTSNEIKDGAVHSQDIHDGGVKSKDIRDGGVHLNDLASGVQNKLGRTLTATTAVSDRDDSGVHGTWAKDTFTRILTTTRHSAVDASKCGGGVDRCWFYTGTITDNGTFTTIEGALSPNDGDPINGIVAGTFGGSAVLEFYASTNPTSSARVPATEVGNVHTTGDWAKLMFADGTQFSSITLVDWGWFYTAPDTCEQWVNAASGNSGDIAGVNGC